MEIALMVFVVLFAGAVLLVDAVANYYTWKQTEVMIGLMAEENAYNVCKLEEQRKTNEQLAELNQFLQAFLQHHATH